jgi:gliding motility-associated-like protein
LKYLFSLTILLISFTNVLKAQSPGGISANNKIWLRSDNGVSTSGTTVTQWLENSGAVVTGNFTVQALAGTSIVQTGPTLIPAGVNFNPYLSFDGITNSLSSANNFLGTALVGNTNVTVFQVFNLKSGTVWLKWETDILGTTARLGFENSAGKIRFDFPRANPASAGQNIGITNVQNKHALSTAYANATTSVNRLNGADDNTIPIPGPGNFAAANTKIVMGNENLINLPCKIDIAEVIIYSNTLTAAERNKIESYLAVKYGFTLNQAAANNNNYVSSNAMVTWDRALNSTYANDIAGIGRDDATALNQKQSKSVNTTALVTIYNGGNYASGVFPGENALNTNTFPNDLSLLLVGDNAGTTTLDQCALDGNAHRMQRVWKTSITGTVSPVTIAVDQASVPATVKSILVSANPAFPLAATTIYPVTVTNGKIYSAVTLTHNNYFTFAGDTLPLPQPQAMDVCKNANGTATILNPLPGAVYNWYNQAIGGVLVATGISITIPNLQNDTTLYVETVSAFNCILPTRVPVTIRVQTVATPQANTIQPGCTTSTGIIMVTAPVGAGYQYCLNGANCQPGSVFSNLPPNTYAVTAVNSLGCVSSVFSVIINSPPPLPAAPALNSPVLICSNQTATLSVTNPLAGHAYNWYAALTGTTPVGTGISYTTPVLLNGATYYAEAVNASGCISPRTSADVQIRTQLSPPFVMVSRVTDSSLLFSWTAVPGANKYSVSTDGISYSVPSSGINGITHLVTGLLPRTTLTLFVKAMDTLITCITSNDGRATGKTLSRYDDVYVPTAFTPNGDIFNNTLKVYGDIGTYRFAIFNRFGQPVFYTTTLSAGWDGTYKGKAQPTGTYVWYVYANLSDGRTVNINGTSVLIR